MLEDVREVCSGFTTIKCATQTTVVGAPERRAYFCFYTNLEYDGTSWVARCAPTRWGRDRRYMGDLPWKLGAVGPLAAANEARTVRLAADAPLAQPGSIASPTYIAFGDCMTGNPGHCLGDWHNHRIARQLWNASRSLDDVILFDGFAGGGRWLHEWPETVVPPRRGVYERGVLSALGYCGPHWRVEVFAARECHRTRQQPLAPSRVLLDINRAPRAPPPKPVCAVLARVAPAARCLAPRILYLERTKGSTSGVRRELTNVAAVAKALAAARPDASVVRVDLGSLPVADQRALVRGAALVVGVHGSAMYNAARWAPRRVVEIHPVRGVGSIRFFCAALGIPYASLVCRACRRENDFRGAVDVGAVLRAADRVFARS